MQKQLKALNNNLSGQVYTDRPMRTAYGTDASIYRQLPLAVAIPKSLDDIQVLIEFANSHSVGLIPRTAGTSLAGQVVGDGVVVDTSRFFTQVLDIDHELRTVTVQPGVIRDELNRVLIPNGLYFGPETSTSNRAMIGGMMGNNSCGANSIVYGSTRDHVVEVAGYLSDGTFARFGPTNQNQLDKNLDGSGGEVCRRIYQTILSMLGDENNRDAIVENFPHSSVTRRNTGYAIDALLKSIPPRPDRPLNLAELITGSEGTLFFATEIRLRCVDPPAANSRLVCAHFDDVYQSLLATRIAMQYKPNRCELIDDLVIAGAQRNRMLRKKMGFVSGKPKAILIVEFRGDDVSVLDALSNRLCAEFRREKLGYEFPVLTGESADAAWQIRKSGLGVINNLAGDRKPVALIEDAAVPLESLPEYVKTVDEYLMSEFEIRCVHYGHAGAGELHLRPELNLKLESDRKKLREIAMGVAEIVKQFRGSLSGEHGDGRLRSELIRYMVGEQCYDLIQKIKQAWDPDNIFNPGKIVNPSKLDSNLRFDTPASKQPKPFFRFSDSESLLSSVELCSGSGDCRKSHLAGGTMCPSYMATRNEYDSTRARANILRDFLTRSDANDAFADVESAKESKKVLDLCLSCKGCKSECPSNVDMAKIKAEFMHAYHQIFRPGIATKMLSEFDKLCDVVTRIPFSKQLANGILASGLKRMAGIHPRRSIPFPNRNNLRKRLASVSPRPLEPRRGTVLFFVDEFTNWIDTDVGVLAVKLLEHLGYRVRTVAHKESGRSAISMGLPQLAKSAAEANVRTLGPLVGKECKLVGVEPSALLTFRDEYPDLVSDELRDEALRLAEHSMLIDEFLFEQLEAGRLEPKVFEQQNSNVLLHGHCHQKALGNIENLKSLLEFIPGCNVALLESGCCGMAGFFGYQADKYELSMQIGELILFPSIRDAEKSTVVVANGTSCRQQIADGSGREAKHVVEFLFQCLK